MAPSFSGKPLTPPALEGAILTTGLPGKSPMQTSYSTDGFLLPGLLFSEFSIIRENITIENILHLSYLSFIASALCFYTWNFATKTLGALKTGLYIYMTPVVTLVFSAITLKEGISLLSILGAVLALFGLVLSEKGVKKTA